jgi:transposase
MIKVNLSAEAQATLMDIHQNHIHHIIRQRAHVLLLRSQKIRNDQIESITGLSEPTIIDYAHQYLEKGESWVMALNFRKPVSQLQSFDEEIKAYFANNPVSTISHACIEVQKLTGITVKNTQMRAYLKKLGIKWRKVGGIPAKVDIDAQQKFHDEQLQPRLEEAKAGKRSVYFMDAAHFVMGAFLGYLWSFTRIFVRTPSGRQRFNVLGALNAITKKLEMVTNDAYITSIQVCELLKKLAEDTTLPITIILDNARYQKCKLVMEMAQTLGIELLFLPSYSPNLNLIERLWKLTKKECLNSRYYNNFALFSGAISTFLTTMESTHKKELNSLLTLKFQLFTEEQVQKAAILPSPQTLVHVMVPENTPSSTIIEHLFVRSRHTAIGDDPTLITQKLSEHAVRKRA